MPVVFISYCMCVSVLYLALLYFTFNLYRAPLKISIQLLSGSPVKKLQLQSLCQSVYLYIANVHIIRTQYI